MPNLDIPIATPPGSYTHVQNDSSGSGTAGWNGLLGSPIDVSATPSGTGCGDISGSWTETDAYGSST